MEALNPWRNASAAARVRSDTIFILDWDTDKFYVNRMNPSLIMQDEKRGETRRRVYWTMQVLALCEMDLVPLYGAVYTQRAEAFVSENYQIFRAVDTVVNLIGFQGTWILDRGGDRRKIYEGILDRGLRFIVRMVGRRGLLCGKAMQSALSLAEEITNPVDQGEPLKWDDDIQKEQLISGYRTVRLPGRSERVHLVVAKGDSWEPTMLLTNLDVPGIGVERILNVYSIRQKCGDLLLNAQSRKKSF